MIDFARITVKAGDGGNGCGSRRQIKGKRYGRADGGDGGRGGDVYFTATGDLNTLESYRYVRSFRAKNGENGYSNLRRGANGEDLVLKVPVGTLVKVKGQSQESGVKTSDSHFDFDLVSHGDRILVARGGQGGRGNAHLRDEFGRRPNAGEPGETGESQDLTLELKLIAEVGLIGLPNAGKSTLLAKLTSAAPKIANYPFTTLEPNLGVMDVKVKSQSFDDAQDGLLESERPRSRRPESNRMGQSEKLRIENSLYAHDLDYKLVLADIPGLIEGASEGKGLGDLFLRHIERTKILVHIIDITSPQGVWSDYQVVRKELRAYSKELVKKKEIIVLNKIDLANSNEIGAIAGEFARHRKKVVLISAQNSLGLGDLVREIEKKLPKESLRLQN